MRDIKRIPSLLSKLEKLWLMNPDLRFGQLVYLLADRLQCNDIFFPEDDKWEDVIDIEVAKIAEYEEQVEEFFK
jgi:hypothetical protein